MPDRRTAKSPGIAVTPPKRKIAFEPFFADIKDGHFNCYLDLPENMTAQISVDGKETAVQGRWTANL
jgi:hypothetical protein